MLKVLIKTISVPVQGQVQHFKNLEENELSPEKLADDLFDNNLTARASFIDQVKEAIPEEIDEIDSSHEEKFENQKLSL